MFKTTHIIYDGVRLEVPVVNGEPLPIPHNGFDDFDTYCGPGWLGDKIVPDKLFGVSVAPACYIHDVMNAMAETCEEDHHSNEVFRRNMISIIEHFEPRPTWEDPFHYARYQRALTYYEWVDTVGLKDDS